MNSESQTQQPSSTLRKTDTEIALEVEDALKSFNCNGKHKISARVLDGIVTLQGTVCSYELRRSVTNAIRNLSGVEGFRNCISIFPVDQSV
ncbi:MAG TPA: BON domain-containing protein [Puia sp.]|jgi:osmotically-inducible protein OsmY|nr:BON domain-containing protein [Puia sp.]